MKVLVPLCLILLQAISGCITEEKPAANYAAVENFTKIHEGKKILVIDSYNEGYEGFELKMKGVRSVLNETGIELKTIHLDEKNNPDKEFQKKAALNAKSVIESFKPDVIITLDDPALKYVIMPYYKDSDIPVVFSGINWDDSEYRTPYNNTAGMIEVALIRQLVDYLLDYSEGGRIGFIDADTLSAYANADAFKKYLNITLTEQKHVKTFEEWKKVFIEIQDQVDVLILANNGGVEGWDDEEAKLFVQNNTRIPTGSYNTWMTPFILVGLIKATEEQGEWSAQTALRILNGTRPSDIPQVTNKRGLLYVNLKIAEKLGLVINPNLLKNAIIIR
ncbi:MAG TPA: ABC transporter substrate binding protein [Candidatus Methylomirabilis sp.]|nr:ABC transporter substrate binding protein [Candidatus Methylomirabilis sp.]